MQAFSFFNFLSWKNLKLGSGAKKASKGITDTSLTRGAFLSSAFLCFNFIFKCPQLQLSTQDVFLVTRVGKKNCTHIRTQAKYGSKYGTMRITKTIVLTRRLLSSLLASHPLLFQPQQRRPKCCHDGYYDAIVSNNLL